MRRLAAAALFAVSLNAQALYQWSFDQDNLHGAADFSWLNHPLTAADRVFVKDGHFYTVGLDLTPRTKDDRRVRFFGVNLAFGANFPVQADAARIAKRLRRLGVNLVRLHHMDSTQDPASSPTNANGILTDGPYPTFNAVSVGRLRDFLSALAAEGIYCNLNLHVGYTFRPSVDQIPVVPGGTIPTQSKPLHIFHPRMVELQRQYASELARRLGLRDNPVLAMVEINNESSLMHEWQQNLLDPVLKGEYRDALQGQWNRWLGAKYGSTAALTAAWGASTPDGADVLTGKWTLEQGHGKVGTLVATVTDGVPTAQVNPGAGSGWLFLKQTGFHVQARVRYVWSFEARADVAAGATVSVPVSVMRDVSPWDGLLYSTITLTNQWQTYTIAVTPAFAIQDSGRVSLDVEYSPGAVYARNMKLVPAGQRGLAAGESVEQGNVSLLGPAEGATAGRMSDYMAFLIATDRAYVNAIRDTVRSETDALVPITGTQMGYGGLAIMDSQDGLDYQDNHFYIDHYNFPNTAWDGFDWRIRDAAAADDGWSAFTNMAWARVAGQPYTVSEFNQPWPNTHGAEIDPSLAAYAAFQDWDGIIHFAYSHGRGWDDGVPNGFNINGDWTKFASIGQSAWIFRTGAVQTGRSPLLLPVNEEERNLSAQSGQSASGWVTTRAKIAREVALSRRVALVKDGNDFVSAAADGGEMNFDLARKTLTVNAPGVVGVFGADGQAGGFKSVLLTALDGQPIASSRRMLLTIPGYSLRTLNGQAQTLKNYPGTTDWWTIVGANARPSGDLNGGSRPTYMQKIDTWVTVRTSATSITVNALNGSGDPMRAMTEIERAEGGFRIHLNADSPWYEITTDAPPTGAIHRRIGR